MSGVIAIVGRPNVGKSALFNRLAGRRIAIVHDQPGVTRDRISAEVEWEGRKFTLIDTGGIGLLRGEKASDLLVQAAIKQVEIAIDAANVVILVVNLQEGLAPLDEEVANRLRASGKSVVLAVNKVDRTGLEDEVDQYSRLGFPVICPVSAIHGHGIAELMQAVFKLLPPPVATEGQTEVTVSNPPLKLAIVGRPNVGKSSLINALTQSDRVIVTSIPGTTRDSVDVPFEVVTEGVRQQYILIDTAGIRKKRRQDDSVEFFSVKRSEDSIERCDIAVLVLDAESGILEQDKKIADLINSAPKACIVAINKWDLFKPALEEQEAKQKPADKKPRRSRDQGPPRNLAEFGQWVQSQLFFLDYAPVIFTSAKEGFNLDRLLEVIRYVADQLHQKIPTSILNRTLQEAIEKRQPISSTGHFLKMYYATQVETIPPKFVLFVNHKAMFSAQYNKYLGKELRKAFGFEGCPLVFIAKPRPKTIEPIRKYHQQHGGQKPSGPRKRDGRKQPR